MKQFKNVAELQNWLKANRIDTSLWGEGNAKTINNLWNELQNGEIAFQDSPPRRLVHVAQVLIRKGKQILLEAEQELANGQRRFRNQPPSEKMKPGESSTDAVLRCFQEELGIRPEDVTFLPETYERVQRESDSLSYPGLTTQYTFQIIAAQVAGLPETDFWRDNQAFGSGDPVKRHLWIWRYAG